MPKIKILFVCTENLQRSPTAESLFSNSKKYKVKSCGISQFAEIIISKESVRWADIIVCMEEVHKEFILENFPESHNKELIVLNILDIYYKDDPKLIELLKQKLKRFKTS